MTSLARTVDEYLAGLPEDRRAAVARVREVVNANLPPGYEEGFQYGGITWFVPKTRLAETYHGQPLALAALTSTKSHMALHMMSIYGDTKLRAWLEAAYQKVQIIAEKTVEGTSQSRSLAELQKLLIEQSRKSTTEKG